MTEMRAPLLSPAPETSQLRFSNAANRASMSSGAKALFASPHMLQASWLATRFDTACSVIQVLQIWIRLHVLVAVTELCSQLSLDFIFSASSQLDFAVLRTL